MILMILGAGGEGGVIMQRISSPEMVKIKPWIWMVTSFLLCAQPRISSATIQYFLLRANGKTI
jgi:hypothetical protein